MKDCSSRVEHPLPNHPSPTHDWETERYMERSKKKKTRSERTTHRTQVLQSSNHGVSLENKDEAFSTCSFVTFLTEEDKNIQLA